MVVGSSPTALTKIAGCSSAWAEHSVRIGEVAGSNPATLTSWNSDMAGRIKIKARPSKPKRSTKEHFVHIYGGETLASLLASGAPMDAVVDKEWDYDNCDVFIKWEAPESDDEFKAREQAYRKRLKEYNAWYEAHRDEIEEELDRRKVEAVDRRDKVLAKEEARLKKNLDQISKQRRKLA